MNWHCLKVFSTQMLADIRPALASDIDALLSIENSVFGSDRISRRAFRHHIGSPTAAFLTASGAGEVMGYALILFRAGSATARLYSLAVSPSSRTPDWERNFLPLPRMWRTHAAAPAFGLKSVKKISARSPYMSVPDIDGSGAGKAITKTVPRRCALKSN